MDDTRTMYHRKHSRTNCWPRCRCNSATGERGLQALHTLDRLLPGDSGVLFLEGVSLEHGRRSAAQHYASYLKQVRAGDASQHAYRAPKSLGCRVKSLHGPAARASGGSARFHTA